jgi:hypothetical protein
MNTVLLVWLTLALMADVEGGCGMAPTLKVVLSVTESYLDVLTNWLVFYHHVCPDMLSHIHLLCFDEGLESEMEAYGLPCKSTFSSHSHKAVFTKRVEVVTDLLTNGHDVLMTDIDALFVRSPFPDLATELEVHGADVISSRGFFPFDVGLR